MNLKQPTQSDSLEQRMALVKIISCKGLVLNLFYIFPSTWITNSENYLLHSLFRLVFSRFFVYFRGNFGDVKEKPTRKTCFSRDKKRLTPSIYLAKFC